MEEEATDSVGQYLPALPALPACLPACLPTAQLSRRDVVLSQKGAHVASCLTEQCNSIGQVAVEYTQQCQAGAVSSGWGGQQ